MASIPTIRAPRRAKTSWPQFDGQDFAARFLERARVALESVSLDEVETALDALANTFLRGGLVFVAGNGGSAATSSHFVSDLSEAVAPFPREPRSLPFAVGLADNLPRLTAIANDIGYDDVFAHQLEGRLRPEDLLVILSGSGLSENLLRAARVARREGARILGILGSDGGLAGELCHHTLLLSTREPAISESVQVTLHHLLATGLRSRLATELPAP